ncbi:DUF1311 domain-containing protein [Cyanobium sp. LEGE 06143]|uniref:lysozyme inhibitor LprI family protein n=1 Tax=Cyanobium sp. LEGE 06143 TaxID=945727 RepID=UPI001880FD52|nr:lysozyme inhibitor LprI family protein [Cyanobium sp. LEGE 06143]MBE9171664.1 DUF1311 domain-containing protein [Cyanobium sp. LEGE 06143]
MLLDAVPLHALLLHALVIRSLPRCCLLLSSVLLWPALAPVGARSGDSPLGKTSPAEAPATQNSLQDSLRQRQAFPFHPDCDGNTQEIVACLWQQRNQADVSLEGLLGQGALLEPWRSSRRQVCEQTTRPVEGGSIGPIVWLGCENALNATLIEQLSGAPAP